MLATNRTETVRDFVTMTFARRESASAWQGAGRERGRVWMLPRARTVVRVNPRYYRPAEVELLIGNPAKAERVLGWKPTTTLESLCQLMYEADRRRVERGEQFLAWAGYW